MSSALIDNDEVFSYPSFGNEAKIKAKKVVVLFLLLLSTKCKKVETKGVPRVRVLDLQKSLCCRSLVRSHRVGLESFQVGSFDLLGTVARKQQLPLGDHCWKSPS